jgi:hypothetical protein
VSVMAVALQTGITAFLMLTTALTVSHAGQVNPKELSDCLITNETPELRGALRDMMVFGLTDDIPKLRIATEKMGAFLVEISMEKCGLKEEDLTDPGFEEGAGKYGEFAGGKLMNEALSKI